MRLSRAMTFKAAAAGLDLGGGKGVICLANGAPPSAASGASCCSTSATWSSRSRAATSPPRTSGLAPRPRRDRRGDHHVTGPPVEPRRHRRPEPDHGAGSRGGDAGLRRASASARRDLRGAVGGHRPRPRRRGARAAPRRKRARSWSCPTSTRASGGSRQKLGHRLGGPGRCVIAPSATCSRRGARRRDRRRQRRAAALRGRLRSGQQPARRGWARRAARGARHPLRARLHRQRRRPDQRLREIGGHSATGRRAGGRDRADDGARS